MIASGSENYVTEYNYNNAQGKYTALLQKEIKNVQGEENPLDQNSNVKQTVYTYDANGNQITKTADGKTETNSYDGLNQLIGFTDGDTTANYKYNASGLRYEKIVDGQRINHVWDGSKQIIADVIDNQFYEADCYIRGTNLVAKYNYRNGDKSEYTYYTQNAHGDVVNLTNADGEVVKSYTYDAFGVEKNIDDTDTNAFRYCGEYFDTETSTIYLRARYYNPSIGRFISRDSFAGKNEDPLSLNRYTYCHNNPVIGVDPSGNFAEAISDFFSEAGQAISNAWETAKGYGGSIINSMSSYSSLYAGCGTAAAADGPLPILDIIAGVTAVGLTGYCVYEGVKAYNDATVLPNEGVLSREKDRNITFAKTKNISDALTIATIKSLPQKRSYSVYGLVDSNKDVQYVGRTKNLAATKIRHGNNPYREDLTLIPFEQNLTFDQARFYEQYYIDYFKTLNKSNNTNNQIRGASEEKYKSYYETANDYYKFITGLTNDLTYVGG